MNQPAITVENVSKRYRKGQTGYHTLREDIYNLTGRLISLGGDKHRDRDAEHIWALSDVSFQIEQGERVGIIGRNGSGKTTLLRLLAGITRPNSGKITVKGRLGVLIEIMAGFNPELTGRENIYLNGAIMGMSQKEIKRKFDEIVAFAELEDFIDTPIKRYSSGMHVRLGFAVSAHLDPDILLIDEVLAVGDAAFQKKCLGKMEGAAQEGRTVVFVSHNMASVKSLCNRALLLDGGRVQLQGPVSKITDRYLIESTGQKSTSAAFKEDSRLRIQFLYVQLIDCLDSQAREVVQLKCRYIVRHVLKDVLLCVDVRNTSDVILFYSTDEFLDDNRKRQMGIHTVILTIPKYLLGPGPYSVGLAFWEPMHHAAEHQPKERFFFQKEEPISRFSAHGYSWPSVIYMPTTWSYVGTDDHSMREDAV